MVSWAWASGEPPLCGGQATGGGVPVAPVGAGLGLGEGEADGLGEGRAMLALGVGTTVVGATELGAGDGVAVGKQATMSATARAVIRRSDALLTFVV